MKTAAPLVLLVGVWGCGSDGASKEEGQSLPPSKPAPTPLVEQLGVTELEDLSSDPDVVEVALTATLTNAEIEPGYQTEVFAYDGRVVGPLIHARAGNKVVVHFTNDLPEPTTIHWHGLRISDQMDGNPAIQSPIAAGETFTYDFVVTDPGTYWYHPHYNTVEQIERGLYAPIVVEESTAPKLDAERVLVLDDIRFNQNYDIAPFSTGGMDAMHGRAGNALLVNGSTELATGKVTAGSIERWRLVNAATARTLEVSLTGASFRVIATDGGLLPVPYATDRVQLAVGQRFDLEVRFDGGQGSTAQLSAHVLAQVDGAIEEVAIPLAEYTVEGENPAPAQPVYPSVVLPETPEGVAEKALALGGHTENGQLVFTVNGQAAPNVPMLELEQGVPVVLRVKNEIGPYHPFHLHGQFFQILTRDGQPAAEPGLKDTVLLDAMQEVTLLSFFENPGEWMYHCHIPEHAELGMMGHVMVSAKR